MKRVYGSILVALLALAFSPNLFAQDYSGVSESAMNQMQRGEYEDYREDYDSTQKSAPLRWVVEEYEGGDRYEGHKRGNMNHGQGTYIWADGARYEGEFQKSRLTGFGMLYDSQGRKFFEGEFKNDQPEGLGTLYFNDGRRYVGEWKNGIESGSGILYAPDGRVVYGGNWENGAPNGIGAYYWEDGQKYVGEFKNGKSHGTGVLYDASGKVVYEGKWVEDKPAE